MRLIIFVGLGAALGIAGYKWYEKNKGSLKFGLPKFLAPNTQAVTSANPAATSLMAMTPKEMKEASVGTEPSGTKHKEIPILPKGTWF